MKSFNALELMRDEEDLDPQYFRGFVEMLEAA